MKFSRTYRLPSRRQYRLAHRAKPQASPLAAISDRWKDRPDILIYSDGREKCNQETTGGYAEYRFRRFLLWLRQYSPRAKTHLCCNCHSALEYREASFEHEALRGKDCDERLYNSYGMPINGASHSFCNKKRGSQRLPIWHGTLDVRKLTLEQQQVLYRLAGKDGFAVAFQEAVKVMGP